MREDQFCRGLTPMAFGDVDLAELADAWNQEQVMEKYQSNIQYSSAEAYALESKTPIMPTSVQQMRVFIRRWGLFIKATLGNRCELYLISKEVENNLRKQRTRFQRAPNFIIQRGPSIMWLLSHATTQFFDQVANEDDFLTAAQLGEEPPRAVVDLDVNTLLRLSGGPEMDLPINLWPAVERTATNQGHQQRNNNTEKGSRAIKQNNNNQGRGRENPHHQTNRARTAWAPAFQNLLTAYSKEQRQQMPLKKLLKANNKDLPWLTTALGTHKRQCLKSIILGDCGPRCKLDHSATLPATEKCNTVAAALTPGLATAFTST